MRNANIFQPTTASLLWMRWHHVRHVKVWLPMNRLENPDAPSSILQLPNTWCWLVLTNNRTLNALYICISIYRRAWYEKPAPGLAWSHRINLYRFLSFIQHIFYVLSKTIWRYNDLYFQAHCNHNHLSQHQMAVEKKILE